MKHNTDIVSKRIFPVRNPVLPETMQAMGAVEAARWLLGKELATCVQGRYTSGIICETEAYEGIKDRACHAYGGRKTERTKVMYEPGGTVYIYWCYGMHVLLNIVVNKKDIPEAVLIRAVFPCSGIPTILKRRKMMQVDKNLLKGPGKVTQGLGITMAMNAGKVGECIYIYDLDISFKNTEIQRGPRVGVDYAGAHARWPYRFWIDEKCLLKNNLFQKLFSKES